MGDLDWTVCAHCAHAFPAVEEACTRCGTQRDDVARPWQAGDFVSLPMHGGPRILRLSASDAADLNAGENPVTDLTALAREVVTLPGWRWMSGMRDAEHGERYEDEADGPWIIGHTPDLSDPATVDCIHALVEEACGGPVSVLDSGPTVTAWSRSRQGHGPTRAEALVALWREVTRG